ncbi:hypothetical protein Pelo_11797 [Pelomyxa schiedti]|nr:hypothetical protein Pelo_11797 [Pelomyxa schiedti]
MPLWAYIELEPVLVGHLTSFCQSLPREWVTDNHGHRPKGNKATSDLYKFHATFLLRLEGTHAEVEGRLRACINASTPGPVRVRLSAPAISKVDRIKDKDITAVYTLLESEQLNSLRAACSAALGTTVPYGGGAGHVSICYINSTFADQLPPLLAPLNALTGMEFTVSGIVLDGLGATTKIPFC